MGDAATRSGPSKPDPRVRPLTPADAEAFVLVRRRALREEPLAFSASPEDDRAVDLEAVRSWLARPGSSAIFGAFAPGLIGAVGLYREEQRKASHKARVWGMYVAPEHRGAGVGAALMQAAIDHARTLGGVRLVQLSVSDGTPAARRLYERLGFTRWGTEEEALSHDGRLVAEHHMVLRLEGAPRGGALRGGPS
jgi:RimJ/RimL family protein N-acetyltransferase